MKIAIVKLSALGDIIHAMVALQFIKKHHPEVQIDWVVEKAFKPILENNPDIHQIHTVNLKQAKAKKSLRLLIKELFKLRKLPKYDVVVDAQGLIKSALVAEMIPSHKTMGFDKDSLREPLAAKFYNQLVSFDYAKNIVKRNVFLIPSSLAFRVNDKDIDHKKAFLFADTSMRHKLLSDDQKNVVIVPGASFISKIYPAELYAQLIEKLSANCIVIWGNEDERQMANTISQLAPKSNVSDKLSLDELKFLIQQSDLVIGGDTGPTHMAWALNRPSITLFGATPSYRNTYVTNINRVIESGLAVDPYKIDKTDRSIESIPVNKVVKIAKELLEESL